MKFIDVSLQWCLLSTFIPGCQDERSSPKLIRGTYTPKRFRSFESSITVTFRFGGIQKLGNTSEKLISLKVFNQKSFVSEFSRSLSVNKTEVKIPCELFATPGRYFIEYFIEGITKTSILLTARPIIVRRERVRIDVQKDHIAFDGSVSAWLRRKYSCCKPFQGKLKLYWIKSSSQHVLVMTKNIKQNTIKNKTRIRFRCNIFDTAGTFYFVYFSDYNNKTIARSQNMSVSWGKYEIKAQAKIIFPCSNSFVIKFSSPYCDRTDDKIEMRSKAYKNFIGSQVAYHGFRSVLFPCEVFKKYIREYCFYYITKSSLTNERKIQTSLCVPSKQRGMCNITKL